MAIALSLDAFSLALTIGLINDDKKTHILYSSLVGVLHFVMPLLGMLASKLLLNNIIINVNKLMGVILLFLAIQIVSELRNDKKENIKLNIPIMALSVSVDSFFIGIGLAADNSLKLVSCLIFLIFSFIFSALGCKLGNVGKVKFGTKAQYLAIIILVILSVKYILL